MPRLARPINSSIDLTVGKVRPEWDVFDHDPVVMSTAELGAIDAPMVMPAGSCRQLTVCWAHLARQSVAYREQ